MSGLLVLAETDGIQVLPATLAAIAFAQEFQRLTNHGFSLLIAGGPEIATAAEAWREYGAQRAVVCASAALMHPTAEQIAVLCVEAMERIGASNLAATASAFGRDVLPRVAAVKDLPMLSDVLHIDQDAEGLLFRRPMYAGNIVATVRIAGDSGVFSIRGTAFRNPADGFAESEVVALEAPSSTPGAAWISLDSPEQKRPELTTARVIVSGGRPLRDAATFERVLGGLADKLGGAVGATRAAVDSGIAPNELQIGQTGKVVAPELYIAAGVSGSVQHLAGMKDSKVIVAINTDPDAPIFQVADYGLVADLHQAVPELTSKL